MTTIIGIQGEGFAVLCADSRVASVDDTGSVSPIFHLGNGSSKIAQNGPYLIGAAGDVRAINILHHAFLPPTPPINLKGKKLDAFITNKFIPALRETFDKQGYSTPEKDAAHIAQHDSLVIIAIHGIIYVIDGDYSWCADSNGYYALGSGGDFALGALHVLFHKRKSLDIQSAKLLSTRAISTASKYDAHTGAPYHTYVQDSSGKQPKQLVVKTASSIKKVNQNAGRTENNRVSKRK